jgi:hypothetical protein
MASLTDLIAKTVASAAQGVEIPSNVQSTVLSGLSDSVFKSLTQTATAPGGIEVLKNLFGGKSNAATSPVTALATKIFAGNILSKLGLGNKTNSALTGLIPTIIGKLSGLIKDMDGDGDVDMNDIILALSGGGSAKKSTGGGLLGAATSILGGILKGK